MTVTAWRIFLEPGSVYTHLPFGNTSRRNAYGVRRQSEAATALWWILFRSLTRKGRTGQRRIQRNKQQKGNI
jgi:hypothetical protein